MAISILTVHFFIRVIEVTFFLKYFRRLEQLRLFVYKSWVHQYLHLYQNFLIKFQYSRLKDPGSEIRNKKNGSCSKT